MILSFDGKGRRGGPIKWFSSPTRFSSFSSNPTTIMLLHTTFHFVTPLQVGGEILVLIVLPFASMNMWSLRIRLLPVKIRSEPGRDDVGMSDKMAPATLELVRTLHSKKKQLLDNMLGHTNFWQRLYCVRDFTLSVCYVLLASCRLLAWWQQLLVRTKVDTHLCIGELWV